MSHFTMSAPEAMKYTCTYYTYMYIIMVRLQFTAGGKGEREMIQSSFIYGHSSMTIAVLYNKAA